MEGGMLTVRQWRMRRAKLGNFAFNTFTLHLRPRPNDAVRKTPIAMSLRHWVFKPGTNAHRWTTNRNAGNTTLGYQLGVGDANQYENEEAMKAAADDTAGPGQLDILWRFKDLAQIGDLVYAFKGNAVCLGVGVITGAYEYLEEETAYQHERKVEWFSPEGFEYVVMNNATNNTFHQRKNYRELLGALVTADGETRAKLATLGIIEQDILVANQASVLPDITEGVNHLFYGPPGTGKTYTITQLQENYTDKGKEMSREAFNISLMEEVSWSDAIAAALFDLEKAKVPALKEHPLIIARHSLSTAKYLNQSLWRVLMGQTVEDCPNVNLANPHRGGEAVFFKEENSTWRFADVEDAKIRVSPAYELYEQFKAGPGNKQVNKRYNFVTAHQQLEYADFIEGLKPVLTKEDSSVSDIGYEVVPGIFYRACQRAALLAGFSSLSLCLEATREERRLRFNEIVEDESKYFVLFIDEINRANLSAMFGELMTLLEDDKRLGAEKELIVDRLPYGKQPFGVPLNLRVVGTMNTADRSVQQLDVALRRRFRFHELRPDPTQLMDYFSDFDLPQMLETMNARIEQLLGKEYSIGHAVFMSLEKEDWSGLQDVFAQQLLPLLEQYFFGDLEKIRLVLGAAFCAKQDSVLYAGGAGVDGYGSKRNNLYRLAEVMDMTTEGFQQAVKAIL
jgi:Cdc6-like AAA superfamily ATPase